MKQSGLLQDMPLPVTEASTVSPVTRSLPPFAMTGTGAASPVNLNGSSKARGAPWKAHGAPPDENDPFAFPAGRYNGGSDSFAVLREPPTFHGEKRGRNVVAFSSHLRIE
jgi:hypothetical protein